MRHYLTVLFCGSLLGAVCAAAAGGALEKYVLYLAALLCILLIVSPFRELELSFSLPEEPSEETLPAGETLSHLAGKEAEEEPRLRGKAKNVTNWRRKRKAFQV